MEHIEDTYLHLVTSLLMEKDILFRADRSDSMTSEDRDDFLPLVSEFLNPPVRGRAFSWDVCFEEGLSEEAMQALVGEQTKLPLHQSLLQPLSNKTVSPTGATDSKKEEVQPKVPATDQATLKETMPMKKRKLSAVSESDAKSKVEIKNDSTANNDSTVVKAKGVTKASPNTTGSKGSSVSSLSAKSAQISKIAGFKKDEGAVNRDSKATSDSTAVRLPSLPAPLPSITSPKGSLATSSSLSILATSSSSPQPQPLLLVQGQPKWTSSQGISGVTSLTAVNNGLHLAVNRNRIPLLASDFGPANGIVIGDGCRVGVYSREERLVRIERFREKKQKRIWRKQIKYDCRKRLADTRPRVKGRFVSRIGENGEELPPEPKVECDSSDGKKKKDKIQKTSPSMIPLVGDAVDFSSYSTSSNINMGSNNSGETSQEEGSMGSDGDDEHSDQMNVSLDQSMGQIIDILSGPETDEELFISKECSTL